MPLSRDSDYSMYLYTCNRCRSCEVDPSPEKMPVCPSHAFHGFFAYSGGGKGYVAQGILEGKVKPSVEAAEVAMACLSCGACAAACPPGFDINAFIRDLRDHLVRRGFYASIRHRAALDRMHVCGNPWGILRPPAPVPAFTGKEDILVFQGCHERLLPQSMKSVEKVLGAAGVSWGALPDEPCCGAPLLELGDLDGFNGYAERLIDKINASGATRVLTLCAHCAATMSVEYMDRGDLEAEVMSLPSFIAELVAEEKLRLKEAGGEVTYHDPCRLARWLEEIDPPREVLAALGMDVIEMPRNGKWTWCCGSGGGVAEIVPGLAAFAAAERIKEAKETGAGTIVTGCGYCASFLGGRGKGIEVKRLIDIVAENLAD